MPSPSLRLRGACFSFGPDVPVLRDADLHLTPGWWGLVGANGAGKSTLLRVLSGELAPGLALRTPGDLGVLRLEQRLEAPDPAVVALSQAWDGDAVRLQQRLGLGLGDLDRWGTLSPGERRRWQVGAALWRRPDVLLLDEPDNHLDAASRAFLVDALRGFGGIGVVISHDRDLLGALCSRTIRLRAGRIDVVEGDVHGALAAWSLQDEAAATALEEAGRRARRAAVQRRRAEQTHARATASRSLRGVDPKDKDARSVNRKAAAAKAEAQHAKAAHRMRRASRRAEVAHAALARPGKLGGDVALRVAAPRQRRLASLRTPALRAGERVLLRDVDVTVERGDRIWVRGPNGAGKSTLLRALLSASGLPEVLRLHLPQELGPDRVAEELAWLRSADPELRGRTLQRFALLGGDPKRLLATARPSPGEARKLALARALARDAALVALDEPDNHLDLPSRRRLEQALSGYPGALLLVTHDGVLGRALTDRVWDLEGGRIQVLSAAGDTPVSPGSGG